MPSPVLISSAQSSAATFTMPAYQVGDLILVFAFNGTSATQVSNPDGASAYNGPTKWNNIATNAGTACAMRLSWRIAHATGLTSATWTNATRIFVSVWRGVDPQTPFGATSLSTTGTGSTTNNTPGLTLLDITGNSLVVSCTGNKTALTMSTPAGRTRQQSAGTNPILVGDTTTAAVSSYAASTITASTTGEYISGAVEILARARWPRTIKAQAVGRASRY